MLSEQAVTKAMQSGAPITCATCTHYHEGNGLCHRPTTCGGPSFGRDFPDYDGPLAREAFQACCLVCADMTISHSMIVPGRATRFGLCSAHVDFYEKLLMRMPKDIVVTRPIVLAIAAD